MKYAIIAIGLVLSGCTATDLIAAREVGKDVIAASLERQRAHTEREVRTVDLAYQSYLSQAREHERNGEWDLARQAYSDALEFLDEHRPELITKIAVETVRELREE